MRAPQYPVRLPVRDPSEDELRRCRILLEDEWLHFSKEGATRRYERTGGFSLVLR